MITKVYIPADEFERALQAMGRPGTRDEALVFQAATLGIAAMRGETLEVVV